MVTRVGGQWAVEELVRIALPACRVAGEHGRRRGPGRPPVIPEWVIMVLIVVAVANCRRSRSAQYRFLATRREQLREWIGMERFPSRTTYFERYRRAWLGLPHCIGWEGRRAIQAGWCDVECVAVDQSTVPRVGHRGTRSIVAKTMCHAAQTSTPRGRTRRITVGSWATATKSWFPREKRKRSGPCWRPRTRPVGNPPGHFPQSSNGFRDELVSCWLTLATTTTTSPKPSKGMTNNDATGVAFCVRRLSVTANSPILARRTRNGVNVVSDTNTATCDASSFKHSRRDGCSLAEPPRLSPSTNGSNLSSTSTNAPAIAVSTTTAHNS